MPPSEENRSLKETVTHIRRNHALEHATIHMLSSYHLKSSIIGRSDHHGFFLYTNLPQQAIEEGAQAALDRLRAGEHRLAVHPNCGTNLLTAGVLSGLATYLSIQGSNDQKDKLKRLPMAVMSAIMGLIVAQPLGSRVQQHLTTKSDPGTLEIVSVDRIRSGKRSLYRILTRQ